MSDKSNKEINGIASGIRDAVDDAVNRGDFSGLSDAIRKTVWEATGSAAGTAADALNSFQGFVQGTPGNTAGGQQPNRAAGQNRTYGHAGYADRNVTEEYMQRASGARHHTTYASKLSPFLQRRISRASGIGRIVGGITCLVMAGFSLLDSLFSGLLHGECVALGMLPMCEESVRKELLPLLKKFDLPTTYDKDKQQLMPLILHDKKMQKDSLTVIYVPQIGRYEIRNIQPEEMEMLL